MDLLADVVTVAGKGFDVEKWRDLSMDLVRQREHLCAFVGKTH